MTTVRPSGRPAGFGWENPDPTPHSLPVYVRQGASTLEQLRAQAFAAQRAAQDMVYRESFEEADDFNVGDEDYERVPFADEVDNRNDHQELVRQRLREDIAARKAAKEGDPAARRAGQRQNGDAAQPEEPSVDPSSGSSPTTGDHPRKAGKPQQRAPSRPKDSEED